MLCDFQYYKLLQKNHILCQCFKCILFGLCRQSEYSLPTYRHWHHKSSCMMDTRGVIRLEKPCKFKFILVAEILYNPALLVHLCLCIRQCARCTKQNTLMYVCVCACIEQYSGTCLSRPKWHELPSFKNHWLEIAYMMACCEILNSLHISVFEIYKCHSNTLMKHTSINSEGKLNCKIIPIDLVVHEE